MATEPAGSVLFSGVHYRQPSHCDNAMKTLTVQITAELQVPDDWEVVEHASGIRALKIGNKFIDFDIEPVATEEDVPEPVWSDDDTELGSKILDCVVDLESAMEIESSD